MDSMEEEDREDLDFMEIYNNYKRLLAETEISKHEDGAEPTEGATSGTILPINCVAAGAEEPEEPEPNKDDSSCLTITTPKFSPIDHLGLSQISTQLVLSESEQCQSDARTEIVPLRSNHDLSDEYLHSQIQEVYGILNKNTNHNQYGLMFGESKRSLPELKEVSLAKEKAPETEEDQKGSNQQLELDGSSEVLSGRFIVPREILTMAELRTLYQAWKIQLRFQPPKLHSSEELEKFVGPFKINSTEGKIQFRSLIHFDPRFVQLSPPAQIFLDVDSGVFGKQLVDTFAALITQHPYGITPEAFKIEYDKMTDQNYNPPEAHLNFYQSLSDIFYVNTTDFYVYNSTDTQTSAVTLLFPSFIKQMDFKINEFYYNIWHQFKILLLTHGKPFACDDGVALLKEKTGIKFNPINWGFPNMNSYFEDCVTKYPDGIHRVITCAGQHYFIRGDWTTDTLSALRRIARTTESASRDFYITPENKHLNLDVENVADWISDGHYLRGLPVTLYQHYYFFVVIKAYSRQLEFLYLKMAIWYGIEANHPTPVNPAHLTPGLFVAAYVNGLNGEAKHNWNRAKIVKLDSPSIYKLVLVDFGKTILCHLRDICYLHIEFLHELAIQAIWCKSVYPAETGHGKIKQVRTDTSAGLNFCSAVESRELGICFLQRHISGAWEVRLDELSSGGLYVTTVDIIRHSFSWVPTLITQQLPKAGNPKYDNYDTTPKNEGGLSRICGVHMRSELTNGKYFGYSKYVSNGLSPYFEPNIDKRIQPMSPAIEEVTEMAEAEILRRSTGSTTSE